jgi:AraC-like DNA-binding protein
MFYYLVAALLGTIAIALALAAALSFSSLATANHREAAAQDSVIKAYDLYLQGISDGINYSALTADGLLAQIATQSQIDPADLAQMSERLAGFSKAVSAASSGGGGGSSGGAHSFYLFFPQSKTLCTSSDLGDRLDYELIKDMDLDQMAADAAEHPFSMLVQGEGQRMQTVNFAQVEGALLITAGDMPVLPRIDRVSPMLADSQMYFIDKDGASYSFCESNSLQDVIAYSDFPAGEESGLLSVEHEGQPYRVYFHNMDSGHMVFVLAMPDHASIQTRQLIIKTALVLVALLALGALCSWLISRKLYEPIRDLIAKLSAGQRQLEKNEFKLINQTFDDVEDKAREQKALLLRYVYRLQEQQDLQGTDRETPLYEQRFYAAIRSLNKPDALRFYDRCIEGFAEEQRYPMALTGTFLTALKSNIILAVYDSEPLRRAGFADTSYAEKIAEAKNTARIREELAGVLESLNLLAVNRGIDDELCRQITCWVQENYTDSQISASLIARQFGLSQSGVTRLFKKAHSMGFLDYLHALRIAKAKELLLTTNLSIAEISIQVGYTSALTMTRAFKRYTGSTPGSFRK